MTRFIDWFGFVGAWLLFAGPVYQAETELDGEARESRLFEETIRNVPRPPSPSKWWWLLPPVGYVMTRRASREHRQRIREVLTPEQTQQLVSFMEKATGWELVAAGAGLIAIKETWSLTEAYEWGTAVFWPLVAAMVFGSLVFTGVRARRRYDMLGLERPSRGGG